MARISKSRSRYSIALLEELLHVRQVRVHVEVGLGLPDLEEDKQRRVLFVAQHVVLDAAGLGATRFHIAAEERFEGVGFFRAGLGVQDEALHFTHQKSPQVRIGASLWQQSPVDSCVWVK